MQIVPPTVEDAASGGSPVPQSPALLATQASAAGPVPPTPQPTAVPVISADEIASLRAAVLILARRMRYQQVGDELTPSESAVLGRVGRLGPITPGQLARSEHVQPPSMTRIIEQLEIKGFLRRDPHPTDRRQVLITRTPAGDEFVAQSRQLRTAWLTGQLAQLSETEQQQIAAAATALAHLAELP